MDGFVVQRTDEEIMMGALFAGGVLLVIVMLVSIIWWRIFKKANRAGWEAIIPVYNVLVLMEILKKQNGGH